MQSRSLRTFAAAFPIILASMIASYVAIDVLANLDELFEVSGPSGSPGWAIADRAAALVRPIGLMLLGPAALIAAAVARYAARRGGGARPEPA